MREVHKLRDLCKDSRIRCGNGGPYHLVSSGIHFVSHVLRVLPEFVFPPFVLGMIRRLGTDLIHSFCAVMN